PTFTDLEAGNGLARLGHHRLLTGNGGHVHHGTVDGLAILSRSTHTHVQGDLGDLRHFHDVLVAKLLDELGHDLVFVILLESVHLRPQASSAVLSDLKKRTFLPSSKRKPMRSARPDLAFQMATLEAWIP